MKNALVILALLLWSGTPGSASPENAAIIEAAKSYVAATSGMTKITVTVEQIAGDFARVKVTPEDANAADPAWAFLKKADGKWTGVILGTSFTSEDYQQLGIPSALRIL